MQQAFKVLSKHFLGKFWLLLLMVQPGCCNWVTEFFLESGLLFRRMLL